MATVLTQVEAIPDEYPPIPADLSTAARINANSTWARIESYIAHRYTPREVVWTVEDEGDWTPPLTPVTITASQKWEGGAWVDVTLPVGPFGYCLPSEGVFRVTATVGAANSDVPAAVSEAFRRLAEYLADDPGTAGASSTSVAIGPIREELNRSPNWVARALQHSGAADSLRPFRRP